MGADPVTSTPTSARFAKSSGWRISGLTWGIGRFGILILSNGWVSGCVGMGSASQDAQRSKSGQSGCMHLNRAPCMAFLQTEKG